MVSEGRAIIEQVWSEYGRRVVRRSLAGGASGLVWVMMLLITKVRTAPGRSGSEGSWAFSRLKRRAMIFGVGSSRQELIISSERPSRR